MGIEKFDFKGNDVRVVIGEDNEPRWVASDVAKVLGYRMASDMTRRLDDDEKGTRSVRTPGGEQDVTVISESGLYSAIIGSKVPEAKKFRRWVTHEVLPQIRKSGAYVSDAILDSEDPLDMLQRALDIAREERAKKELAEAKVSEMEPKALFADAVSSSHSEVLVGELAKILRGNGVEIGQQRMFAWLRENGFLIARKGSDWNMPTQKAMDLELFRIKETAISHSDGHVSVSKTPKVTGKGQQYFVARFLDGRFAL